jgi:hypothetical protein
LQIFLNIFILIFIIFSSLKVYRQYFFNQKRITWQDNKIIKDKVIPDLIKIGLNKKEILVLGNHVEIYFYLNKKPPTYFPLVLNFVPEFYKAFFYQDYLNALKNAKILLLINDDLKYQKILNDKRVKEMVQKNFKKVKEEKEYQILTKN